MAGNEQKTGRKSVGFDRVGSRGRAALRRGAALLAATLAVGCATAAPSAGPPAATNPADAKFAAFIHDFRAEALRAGIKPDTYDASMAGLARNARVEQLNLQQPEFAKPVWDYLDGIVSARRVANGQQMVASYPTMLTGLEARYGVAKEILVAIWGVESNYGHDMGSFNLFEALATLAYDGPRQDFARHELIAALKMEEQEHLTPAQMTASWAGAFGETQFVPSSFLAHAVDGDGDGKRDLWHSPADALASTALLLRDAGWQKGAPCLTEVALPKDFAFEQADADNVKALTEWKKLGVKTVYGGDLPAGQVSGALYLPAGWRGPAFLVFDNFKTVLKYNNAATYALAVCNLADRIRGGGAIVALWPRDESPLSHDDRIAFQTDLKALGYDPGDIDGVLGRRVRAVLRKYQLDHHLPADGFPTMEMLGRLNAELKAKR
jgi:membrane-bound lytic murein transglycosylase B